MFFVCPSCAHRQSQVCAECRLVRKFGSWEASKFEQDTNAPRIVVTIQASGGAT